MHSFGLDKNPGAYADLTGWIVTVLQAGKFALPDPIHPP